MPMALETIHHKIGELQVVSKILSLVSRLSITGMKQNEEAATGRRFVG